MFRRFISATIVFIALGFSVTLNAASISDFTDGMEKKEGFFDLYIDEAKAQVYLKVENFNQDFIYQVGLPAGLGSNDIGLDRGQLSRTRLVYFGRVGDKVLLHEKNPRFRADSDNPHERNAVTTAFAQSVVWGFKVEAEDRNGSVLINMTDVMLDDQHRIAASLKRNKEGDFSLDKSRSAPNLEFVKTFPKNTELQSFVTFKGENPGRYVRSVAANPNVITLQQRISMVELPDDNYKPRKFHPNMSFGARRIANYAAKTDEPMIHRFINRHRLEKKDPTAAVSEAVEPIIYYVDNGAPEAIRNALIEGASWWNEAFETAGFKDAFQVKVMPEDMDPQDARYNVIHWVHRSTRGWSYGDHIPDPRTGEIIKGHVTLGSLRSRQDFLIATALTAPYDGEDNVDEEMELMLARTRQLAAHEVGHTIGIAHNYIASMKNDDDVMDYPHPKVGLDANGEVTLKNPYREKIGEWNKITIQYGYGVYENEDEALKKILDDAYANGHRFVADGPDSRGAGSLHADSHLWDFGSDVFDTLEQLYAVRAKGLAQFSTNNIPDGTPLSSLEETLVPLYYLPRFQLNAVTKSVGGMIYQYNVKGDNRVEPFKIVPRERQDKAIEMALKAVHPDYLALPKHIIDLIPPKSFGYSLSRESFPRDTGRAFDTHSLAEANANHVLSLLFEPTRLARVHDFATRDDSLITLDRYIVKIAGQTVFLPHFEDRYKAALHRRVANVFVHNMMKTASNRDLNIELQAVTASHLNGLKGIFENRIEENTEMSREYKSHYQRLIRLIDRFQKGEYAPKASDIASMPPGEPI